MKSSLAELFRQMPGAATAEWPQGEPYAVAFEYGTMTLGFYAPVGNDPQSPHERDEIYIIHAGEGEIVIANQRDRFAPGDAFFVAAGVEHRFEAFSAGFSAWVVFWGPPGGERSK
jgi:mannose-6-phosphate isomerase-like protein (cupin superfamily)